MESGTSIYEQTGWKRPFPLQICQDLDALEKVHIFTYDLDDEKFVDYFEERTGLMISFFRPEPGDMDPDGDDVVFRNMGGKLCGGTLYKGSWEETWDLNRASTPVPEGMRWVQLTKAQLQDCWELYQNDRDWRAYQAGSREVLPPLKGMDPGPEPLPADPRIPDCLKGLVGTYRQMNG